MGRSAAALALVIVGAAGSYVWLKEEERVLTCRFGPAYQRYRARVPRFIPRFELPWSGPAATDDRRRGVS